MWKPALVNSSTQRPGYRNGGACDRKAAIRVAERQQDVPAEVRVTAVGRDARKAPRRPALAAVLQENEWVAQISRTSAQRM